MVYITLWRLTARLGPGLRTFSRISGKMRPPDLRLTVTGFFQENRSLSVI